MKLELRFTDTNEQATDTKELMLDAGLQYTAGRYQDFGVLGNGSIIVLDSDGNTGYLSTDKYTVNVKAGYSSSAKHQDDKK